RIHLQAKSLGKYVLICQEELRPGHILICTHIAISELEARARARANPLLALRARGWAIFSALGRGRPVGRRWAAKQEYEIVLILTDHLQRCSTGAQGAGEPAFVACDVKVLPGGEESVVIHHRQGRRLRQSLERALVVIVAQKPH